ncbi:uncharacterized protein C9orf57-like [Mauremys mutica]|uniref:UPAR/Ly6 domain-containing protein n=1 Tax=Mauremys mutica TaxID=74926 RepID=A0A9D3X883_9SAUR|nr:uncharacterized protein C9orf57-like [Mauremys mutica]XP_044853239.1 uncharacterized protein C9orf57-like [Mauremys mutica]KAH1175297.1 hypothetical protein KIL84_008171 [Mauremys mutica]
MNKMLVPVFTALLYFATAGALLCHVCVRRQPNKTCLAGKSMCKAGPGESCYLQTLLLGNFPLYSQQGCFRDCQDQVGGTFIHHVFHCCTEDFCNA